MNLKFLKAPIGSDEWVQKQLDKKLKDLQTQVRRVSKMPFLHEAFTLLKHCATICKVNHLLRTLPPSQLTKFICGFDTVLQDGMETLLGHKLTNWWWRIAQLPAKFGGFGLRTGRNVAGAQHLMSLFKCSPGIRLHLANWSLLQVAKYSSEEWLKIYLGENFDISSLLILSQLELTLRKRVFVDSNYPYHNVANSKSKDVCSASWVLQNNSTSKHLWVLRKSGLMFYLSASKISILSRANGWSAPGED